MRRRALLGLAAGAAAGRAGCTASALPDPGLTGGDEPGPAVLDVDRTVCPGGDGPVAVERSSETVVAEDWSLVVSLTNRSGDAIGLNPHGWSVHREAAGGWTKVAPDAHFEPWFELAPGEAYTWLLSDGERGLADADQRVTLSLSAGRHAFAVPVRGPTRIGAVAPFTVER